MAYVPGMPSSVYNNLSDKKKQEVNKAVENKQKQQKSGGGGSSSSSKPSTAVPANLAKVDYQTNRAKNPTHQTTSIPTSVPQNVRSEAQYHVYQQQEQKQQQQQAQSNNNYINTLLGDDASKVLAKTNTAQLINAAKSNGTTVDPIFRGIQEFNANKIYEVLPTYDREQIARSMQKMYAEDAKNGTVRTNIMRTPLMKEVYKIMQQNAVEYNQRTLKEMEESNFWQSGQYQHVSYATAADYYQMMQNGFETVYIEDGNGMLDNKGGVYTIGRDKLSGVPRDIKSVIVDSQGNWRYIADTGSRAKYVEEMQALQYASNIKYEREFHKHSASANFTYRKLQELERRIENLSKTYDKSRRQSDLTKLQEAIELHAQYKEWNDTANFALKTTADHWASQFTIYDNAIKAKTKWTVADEERYQALKKAIPTINNTQISSTNNRTISDSKAAEAVYAKRSADKSGRSETLLAEYLELSKRRKDAQYSPVFMTTDALTQIKEQEENMKKAVDAYNIWDQSTVHLEDGEDVGTYVKRLLFRDLLYTTDEERESDLPLYMQGMQNQSENPDWGAWFSDRFNKQRADYFKEDLKGIWESGIKKIFYSPFASASADKDRARQAYIDAEEKIKSGELSTAQINDLRAKQQEYLEAQNNAFKQARSILFNNVVSNLSIFDLASFQSTWVSYRMAAHPERYANDPKFKKMQEAYKAIYGKDYRGAIDAGKMMQAMLDVKLGRVNGATGNDYIYVDGSDLRYASGDKYGLFASLGVGLATDISFILGAGKTVAKTAVSRGGAKILAKSASDSLLQSLTRAEVSREAAEQLVNSRAFQKALGKDINKALKKYVREGGVELEDSMRTVLKNRADDFKYLFAEDMVTARNEARYLKFMDDAERTVASVTDLAERSMLIQKGTVIAKTLGSLDEAIDKIQTSMFKLTCPVAGAVTAVAKSMEGIKYLKNLKAADPELLQRLAVTQNIEMARIANLSWDSILDVSNFKKACDDILNEYSFGVMGGIEHRLAYGKDYKDVVARFSNYKDGFMQGVATSYVDNVISKLRTTISGDDGITALEALAKEHGFNAFDDMHSVIRNNLEEMFKYSPDARGILDSFDNLYNTKLVKSKLQDIKKYVKHTADHVKSVNNALDIKNAKYAVLSVSNAELNPDLVQAVAKNISDGIHDFLYTVDADRALFTDAAGNLSTIHEAGVAAIDALDDVAMGNLASGDISSARAALMDYVDQVEHIYLKNLNDWEANVMRDALGEQHYLDNISEIVPNHAGNREIVDTLHTNIMNYFEKRGINVTSEDIDKVLTLNSKDFEKMSITEQQSVIYRITENKGTNAIAQIHDANLKTVTDALVDCNSQLNKNIRLLQMRMGEAASKRVTDAITNASAMENTRILNDVMKSGGVDSTMHMAVMDVLSGNSYAINRIIQTNSPDIAASKVRDYIMAEVQKQLSLHNGTYSTFRNLAADTVDVRSNVLNIEKNLADNIPEDENCIDICVSMVRSTDSAAPKDIAFHVRGSSDAPTVLRKDTAFSVYDNGFASRTYGKSAAQITQEYEALGLTGGLSSADWQRQLKAYIDQQKQIALEQNKTIRFIGFNSSDAITGNNKYLSDVLRSCGVNANMSNSLDLADIMRAAKGEYVFDSAQIDALTRGLHEAIDNARARSISLGISPVIAYDSKYTCADMIKGVLDKQTYSDDLLTQHAKYITEELETTVKGLGTGEYNKTGLAMGAYLDATAFAQIIEDAGQSAIHANGDLMKIISETVGRGETQLGLHKIIETAMDNEWIDYSKVNPIHFATFASREKVHETILQINQIHNGLHRADLITEADREGLMYIHKELIESLPAQSHAYFMTHLFKVEDLSVQQLYSVNKWLLDQASIVMSAKKYDDMYCKMLFNASRPASYLSDTGYRFVRSNIVDYTEDTVDAFLVKYLDTSEEGYRFAQALNELAELDKTGTNLKNYQDAVEGIFKENNIHGVEDRMIVMQMAEVHRPLIEFQDEIRKAYDEAYTIALKELHEEAPYSTDMIERIATERGVAKAKEVIMRTGDIMRQQSVQAVAELNEEALKTHLIRNCCGGIVIDPSSKCVKDLDLVTLFEQWGSYDGIKIEQMEFSHGNIANRKLFKVYYVPEEAGKVLSKDDVFAKYNHARVSFRNDIEQANLAVAERFDPTGTMRHASFGASDGTLMNAEHLDNFRSLFFGENPDAILDLNKNFRSWSNELYSCNMWTDMDLKQLVNQYYTDNILNNMAQNTHQLRNNISAVHDLGSIINNKYMNSEYILKSSGVLTDIPIWEQRDKIVKQLTDQKQHLCKIDINKHNKLTIVDYTPRLMKKSTNNAMFKNILENTVMLDDAMVKQLSDWTKQTSVALRLQASNTPEWLSSAYNIYKKTIRNATITWYLYGNLGTAVRNAVDSSVKGFNETAQYDQSISTYIRKYLDAIKDTQEYTEIYKQIEDELGTVNRETVAKFFNGDTAAMNKFNILYGYEHTCGGDQLLSKTLKETREEAAGHFVDETVGIDLKQAEAIRKTFDSVYSSTKYYGLTNAQLEQHMVAIHKDCMDKLRKTYNNNMFSEEQLKFISDKFWDYHPATTTWGDKMSQFPLLSFNKTRFNNAETRARLAVYQTFLEGGASEYEAMQHVTATQFHYAGIGKVEDFMPFTQYKLYNALYWFDHANARSVSTAWRYAQYNDDGSMTNQEIAALITKYNQKNYYIFDQGADSDYDEYFENNLNIAGHILLDGVDSYLGVPRTFNVGNIDLNGTHYLKLGNSFVEELDMITSLAVGAYAFTTTFKEHITDGDTAQDKLRNAYESFKYTPLYDSFYSPWKSYIDLIEFSYNNKRAGGTSKDIWDNYADFMANKGTHSEAIAALPVIGAILSNMVGRWKSFDLNLGEIAALVTDPDAKVELYGYVKDLLCDTAGMFIPSVVGTKVEPEQKYSIPYGARLSQAYLVEHPETYFDIIGRLQNEMGFDKDRAQEVWGAMQTGWELKNYRSKLDYYYIAKSLYDRGFTPDEISNLFVQQGLPDVNNKRFLAMTNALPSYLKYDKHMRQQVIAYYKAMGMTSDQAWARLMSHPAVFKNGKLVELSYSESLQLSKQHDDTWRMLRSKGVQFTDEDWDAYWATLRELGFYYPKGKWKETRDYLVRAGYSYGEARDMLLHGYMLDNNGKLVDVQGQARKRVFSYQTLKGAEWDAYWATVPDYTKYEKGAFGRTMKALKKMGYTDAQARALIQQGIYVGKDGKMMNVTGMQRPVLGYPNFNAYYNTIPEYCRYEKGAFKRTYAALKQLGFSYDMSLTLIQQGAYLMDASMIPSITQTLGARRQKDGSGIPVTNITTLILRYGGQIIKGADGKNYMLIDCSGLTRPRKSFGYSRRSGSGGYSRRNYSKKSYSGSGRRWVNYPKRKKKPRYNSFYLRQPFVYNNNVSSYNGFTNYRGKAPGKLTKPYVTKGYVSTYSMQNFLNGSSYGMRKVYKIDMRQYKSGALSTKSAYPAAYRNIAVGYRRNLYKDLYAKYGASRMQMRANQAGYSNASIVRLRRNEIYNRERYAERRDRKANEKVKTRATR